MRKDYITSGLSESFDLILDSEKIVLKQFEYESGQCISDLFGTLRNVWNLEKFLEIFGSSEILWNSQGLQGNFWDFWWLLRSSGVLWGVLENSWGSPEKSWEVPRSPGESWTVLESLGKSCKVLKSSRESWGILGISGDSWGILGTPWNFWRLVNS